jgi:hypothetical protein
MVPGAGTGLRNPKIDFLEWHFRRKILGKNLDLQTPERGAGSGPNPGSTQNES